MAGRQIRLAIVGDSRSAIRALDKVESTSRRVAKNTDATMSASASRIGGSFRNLDSQLAAFGVPFAGALSAVGDNLRKTERSAASLTGRLSTLGGAITLGAAAGVAFFGKAAVDAAIEGEQATAQLRRAIENTGGSYDRYESQIAGAADRLAEYGFENDYVEQSIASLTRVTKDAGRAIELQGLAADIAKARGIDLAAATNILVAVEAGRYTILRRQLGLTAEQVKGIKSEADAINLLSSIYGGAAAAAADTFAGKVAALQAKTANLTEEFGMKLLPVVEGAATGLLATGRAVESANSATDGWLGRIAAAATLLPVTVFAVEKLGAGLTLLQAQYAKAGVAAAGSAAGTTAAALAAAEQALADASVAVAKNAVIAAQQRETIAAANLTAATEVYTIAVNSAQVASLRGAAADDVLTQARNRLNAATTAATAAAGRAQLAQAELAVAEATAAGTAAKAGKAANFLGTGVSAAGVAGAAAVAGLLSFQGATYILDKTLGATKPNVDAVADAIRKLGETGTVSGELARSYGTDLGRLAGAFRELDKSVSDKIGGLDLAFIKAGAAGRQAEADIGALDEAIVGIAKSDGIGAANVALAELSVRLADQGIAVDEVIPRLRTYLTVLEDYEATATPAQRAQDALTEAQAKYRRDVDAGTASRQTLEDDLKAIDTASSNLARENLRLAQTEREVEAATTASAKTLEALAVVAGQSAADQAVALGLTDAQVKNLTKTVEGLETAYRGSFEAATNTISTFDEDTSVTFAEIEAELQKNIEATANWSTNLAILARAGIDQGFLRTLAAAGPKSAPYVQAIVDAIDDGSIESINNLQRWAAAVQANTDAALAGAVVAATIRTNEIAAKIAALPDNVTLDVIANLIPGAGLRRLPDGSLALQTAIVTFTNPNAIPGRANGGPVDERGMYVVGERGPELFVPNTSGTIVPNEALRRTGRPMAAATTGGSDGSQPATVAVPIIVELDGKVIADTVVKHSGRVGGLPIRIRAAS